MRVLAVDTASPLPALALVETGDGAEGRATVSGSSSERRRGASRSGRSAPREGRLRPRGRRSRRRAFGAGLVHGPSGRCRVCARPRSRPRRPPRRGSDLRRGVRGGSGRRRHVSPRRRPRRGPPGAAARRRPRRGRRPVAAGGSAPGSEGLPRRGGLDLRRQARPRSRPDRRPGRSGVRRARSDLRPSERCRRKGREGGQDGPGRAGGGARP